MPIHSINSLILDNNNNRNADVRIGYGKTTDQVIVGDWDGDGDDNIGLKRGDEYRFDDDNNGSSDTIFDIGRNTDRVIIGDWDDDAMDEVGLKRYNRYFYDNNNNGSADVSYIFSYF